MPRAHWAQISPFLLLGRLCCSCIFLRKKENKLGFGLKLDDLSHAMTGKVSLRLAPIGPGRIDGLLPFFIVPDSLHIPAGSGLKVLTAGSWIQKQQLIRLCHKGDYRIFHLLPVNKSRRSLKCPAQYCCFVLTRRNQL